MAKYSVGEILDTLGGKKKLSVIAGITAVTFLFGGCMSAVTRATNKTAATTTVTETKPEAALYGTYYGQNGSVLILRDDGNADYFYTGQNDVKHSNPWSLKDNEITINMTWLFCNVKGTIEQDPTSFVLVGDSALDDILWDDERFEMVSTDTLAMTKDECEAFIAERQNSVPDNAGNETIADANSDSEVSEYSVSVDYDSLSVDFVDVGCWNLPVPREMTLTDSAVDADQEFYTYSGNGGVFGLCSINVPYTVSGEEFHTLNNSYMTGFMNNLGGSSINSETDTLVGGHQAIEDSFTVEVNGVTVYGKSMMIDFSSDGYFLFIVLGYPSYDPSMRDYYYYAISVVQDPSNAGSASSTPATTTSAGSSNVRDVLDQYESFMDEYIAFMQAYNSATPDQMMDMYDDYLALLDEYLEMQNMIDGLDVTTMSDDDYAYYLEVTARVAQNLMSVY